MRPVTVSQHALNSVSAFSGNSRLLGILIKRPVAREFFSRFGNFFGTGESPTSLHTTHTRRPRRVLRGAPSARWTTDDGDDHASANSLRKSCRCRVVVAVDYCRTVSQSISGDYACACQPNAVADVRHTNAAFTRGLSGGQSVDMCPDTEGIFIVT